MKPNTSSRRARLSRALSCAALTLCACGGDDASDVADGSSSSSESEGSGPPPVITTTTGATTTTGTTEATSTTTGPTDDSGSESSTGEPIDWAEPCAETPEIMGPQQGDPRGVKVWEDAAFWELVVEEDGGQIISGYYETSIAFGSQVFEQVEAKGFEEFTTVLDPNGEPRWLVPYLGPNGQGAREAARTTDGDVVAGGFFGTDVVIGEVSYASVATGYLNGLLVRHDGETGEVLWVRTVVAASGEPRGEVTDVVATDDGGVLAVFQHEEGTWILDAGDDGLVVDSLGGVLYLRFDADGALVWSMLAQKAPSTSFEIDAGGAARTAGGFAVGLAAAGGIEIDGVVYEVPDSYESSHVVWLSDDGEVLRNDMFSWSRISDVVSTHCDDVIIDGRSNVGFADLLEEGAWVARLTNEGELRWAQVVAIGDGGSITEAAVDPAGQTVVAYEFGPTQYGFVKYDPDGNGLWRFEVDAGDFYALPIAMAANGMKGTLAAGYFVGELGVPGLAEPGEDGAFMLDISP